MAGSSPAMTVRWAGGRRRTGQLGRRRAGSLPARAFFRILPARHPAGGTARMPAAAAAETLIRNAAWAVVWDAPAGRHAYARGVDIRLAGGRIVALAPPAPPRPPPRPPRAGR